MFVVALPAPKLRHDEREDLVSLWGAEQGLLVEQTPEFAEFVATFAPGLSWKPNAYEGRIWIEVERLYRELDERQFVQRNKVDLRRILAAAFVAGATDEPEPIDGRTEVVAVHLAYRLTERVRFVNLDLDGTNQDPVEIIAVLRDDIGDDALLVTSGSGREGRYRVLVRLAKSKEVQTLQTLVRRWISGLGLEVQNGKIEIFPSPKCGRVPFGLGGCERYSLDLSQRKRERPIDLVRAFRGLKTVELSTLASRFPVLEHEHEPTENAAKQVANDVPTLPNTKQSLPRRYVAERRPPTPPKNQKLAKKGISGPGERDDARYKLARDRQIRGWSEQKTIEYLRAWILDGKIDPSREAQKNRGIEGQLRDVERLVKRVYATHPLPGRPEPVDLSASEVARIREHAAIVAMATGFTENALRSFLMAILPLFKAARCAGLPHVRIHTDEWRKAGGSRVTQLREACVLFAASTGYRSANSLRKRGLSSQAAIEHAYAQSWTTSFQFDKL